MFTVLLALLPVVAAYIWLWGVLILSQLALAAVTALIAEAAILALRKLPVRVALLDGSALVTALLLVLCLPPSVPPWVVVIGVLFAIVVAKHLYGGVGYNLFNPAMAGYLVVLVAFPAQLTLWPTPDLHGTELGVVVDSTTMATPLDALRTGRLQGKAVPEAMAASPLFGLFPNGVTAILALALKVPVFTCFGLYLGGNRYQIHFDLLSDVPDVKREERDPAIEAITCRYAERLEQYARKAPYNWFNFYDFWQRD